jgi:predicted DNA-binding antitoxin AbrB/MazE fold protein
MKETIPAVYENGRLRPLKPLHLQEDEQVTISIEPRGQQEPDRLILDPQRFKAMIRRAVARFFPKGSVILVTEWRESCYDVAARAGIIGAIKGGPSDLSTNPKYLEGFGE